MRTVHRALGIAPTSRGFGYAVLEDGELLVDYGLTHQRPPDDERLLRRARELIQRHRPDQLVVRDPRGSRLGERSRRLLEGLAKLGEQEGVEVYRPMLDDVRRHFAGDGFTKHDRAQAVVARFPELRPKLPAKRKPWESEEERMAMFEAVVIASTVTAQQPSASLPQKNREPARIEFKLKTKKGRGHGDQRKSCPLR